LSKGLNLKLICQTPLILEQNNVDAERVLTCGGAVASYPFYADQTDVCLSAGQLQGSTVLKYYFLHFILLMVVLEIMFFLFLLEHRM